MSKTIQCAICKQKINQSEYLVWEINPGTELSYYCCEDCHDQIWDNHKITDCVACGGWFEVEILKSDENPVGGDTFTACPCCGHDIVSGETREERVNN